MFSAKTESGYLIEIPSSFDNYSVVSYEGRGCFSVVFKVRDNFTNIIYAAKVLSKKDMMNQNCFDDVCNEITIHMELTHPNILRHYHTFEMTNSKNEELIIVIEEYCSKGNLLKYIKNHSFKNSQERIYIEKGIIEGVKHLHNLGYAHCDLKLDNILLDKNMNAKLSDFGLCEKCINQDSIYFKSDIWSIGMILYTLFEGQKLGKNIYVEGHLVTRIENEKLRKLVDKCTLLDLKKRPNIDEVCNDEYFMNKETKDIEEMILNCIDDEDDQINSKKEFVDSLLNLPIKFEKIINKKIENNKKKLRTLKKKSNSGKSNKSKEKVYNVLRNDDENDDFIFYMKI